MTNQPDERLGLPSGSSALEDSLCAGRYQLQRQWDEFCPETVEESASEDNGGPDDIDRDREAGVRIHLLYAGKECPEASSAEHDRAEKARAVDEKIKSLWVSQWEFEPLGTIQEWREKRWWLHGGLDAKPIYSGQTDVVWIRGEAGGSADILVGDLKGLWGHHDSAPLNMQIRRYVALIAENIQSAGFTELRSATAYLNQPAKSMNPVVTQFFADDIATAVMEMQMDVAAMTDPDAARTAGSVQCHRCRAKLICAEYQEAQAKVVHAVAPMVKAVPLTVQAPNIIEIATNKVTLAESLKALSSEQLVRLLPWCPALENAAELARQEAKRRLRIDMDSVPGWQLVPNSPRARVEDVLTVFNRFAEGYGVDSLTLTKLCSITKKALTDLLRAKSGLKGGPLADKLDELLKDCVKMSQVQSSLEKING